MPAGRGVPAAAVAAWCAQSAAAAGVLGLALHGGALRLLHGRPLEGGCGAAASSAANRTAVPTAPAAAGRRCLALPSVPGVSRAALRVSVGNDSALLLRFVLRQVGTTHQP